MRLPNDTTPPAGKLFYASDRAPGIRRRRRGGKFIYLAADGRPVADAAEIARIDRLAIPPAYTDVWIAPQANAHLLATGRDARGRKQYRYHPQWQSLRDRGKYDHLEDFGKGLPAIRRQVESDLRQPRLTRSRVIAAVVHLLDIGHIRVGNAQYTEENESFGATTLLADHAAANGQTVTFNFIGKAGKPVSLKLHDGKLARVVRRCHELSGQQLFLYVDDSGERRALCSQDVNAYLHEVAGAAFSAKQFRTWAAGVIAFMAIHRHLQARDGAVLSVKDIVDPVAQALGNTPAISRSSYIHPALIDAVKNPPIDPQLFLALPRRTKYLDAAERGFLRFLQAI